MRLLDSASPDVLMITLEDLSANTELRVRAYSVLRRHGVKRVADILNLLSREEILAMRGMNENCGRNIAEALLQIGIQDTVWDTFLPEETE